MHTTPSLPAHQLVQGPVDTQRWGSVGFRLDDGRAAFECRRAARWMMERWKLTWVPALIDDTLIMVSELVTNAQRHAPGDGVLPAGSMTLWHPNRRLILTVHDKGRLPLLRTWRTPDSARDSHESGRGMAIVRALAAEHLGDVDVVSDRYAPDPGKVFRVNMLLPDVVWGPAPPNPWRNRLNA